MTIIKTIKHNGKVIELALDDAGNFTLGGRSIGRYDQINVLAITPGAGSVAATVNPGHVTWVLPANSLVGLNAAQLDAVNAIISPLRAAQQKWRATVSQIDADQASRERMYREAQ